MFGRVLFGLALCWITATVAAQSLQIYSTANSNGHPGWALYMDLTAAAEPVRITGLTTFSQAAQNATFSIEIFRRDGTALAGVNGPGSSPDGWDSLGIFEVTQGPEFQGLSLPVDIRAGGLAIPAGQTVGVAIRFIDVGPRYFGSGVTPHELFQNADLAYLGGDARSTPFQSGGLFYSSRAHSGEFFYDFVSGPNLAVTIDGTSTPVLPGGLVTYDVEVVNDGVDVADDVALELALPPGATLVTADPGAGGACVGTVCTWSGATAIDARREVSYQVTMGEAVGDHQVTATATTTSNDFDPDDNTAHTITTVENADLSVAFDGPVLALPGSTILYTITATNTGPSDARDVWVGLGGVDPDGFFGAPAISGSGATFCDVSVCLFGGLTAPGESRTVTLQLTLTTDAVGLVHIGGGAVAASLDASTSNNGLTASVLVGDADLGVALVAASDPAIAGDTLEYIATAASRGPLSATDLSIVFTPSAGLVIDSATADGGGTCAIDRCTWIGASAVGTERIARFRVTPTADASGTLLAGVTVEGTGVDPVAGNDTATLSLDIARVGDLQIAKDDGLAWTRPGDTVVYVITAANAGPSDLSGVGIADVLPPGLADPQWTCVQAESTATCPAPPDDTGNGDLVANVDLPAGTVLRFDVAATVAGDAGTTIVNTATIAIGSDGSDPDPNNNSASDSTFVAPDTIFANGFEDGGKGLSLPAARRLHLQAVQRGR